MAALHQPWASVEYAATLKASEKKAADVMALIVLNDMSLYQEKCNE